MRKKRLKPADQPALTGFNADLPEDIRRVFDELRAQTDRGVALVGAAYVEELLERAIQSRLCVHSPDHRKALFEGPNSAMGTFSSKIAMAYALDLVGQPAHEDMQVIRKIRNEFAHSFEQLSFAASPISERTEALTLPEYVGGSSAADVETHRCRFIDSVRVLTAFLLAAGSASRPSEPSPSPPRS
ncbi:hypothetical protein [Bosea minatitlanensis]|uniref:Mannitol repressor n=1 Tax=Bosea minatitlanensis TaxID=128782 RepID=A0ABW0F2G9_9HYPH|nr:hypothetical protein [Bosea minatitlanensis]MCT4492704.1 hypothetical protein [Bosea minatitlanensis]